MTAELAEKQLSQSPDEELESITVTLRLNEPQGRQIVNAQTSSNHWQSYENADTCCDCTGGGQHVQ